MTWWAIGVRVGAAVALGLLAWRCAHALTPVSSGAGARLVAGAGLTLATLTLVGALLRMDGLAWRSTGMRALPGNLRAMGMGMAVWLLPAAAGMGVCLAAGWVHIEFVGDLPGLTRRLLMLAMTVLLIEALPEELLFRGYVQATLGRHAARWMAVLLQAVLFCLWAWSLGAMHTPPQWLFLPGFALLLGYLRALSGNVWTTVGMHLAWMTTTQILAAHHGQFQTGPLTALQVVAFTLLPSATASIVLNLRRPGFDWRRRDAEAPRRAA